MVICLFIFSKFYLFFPLILTVADIHTSSGGQQFDTFFCSKKRHKKSHNIILSFSIMTDGYRKYWDLK